MKIGFQRGLHGLFVNRASFYNSDNVDAVRKCITASFFANAAKLHYTGVYKTVRDEHVLHIHPTSVLFPEVPPQWVVFNEVVQTSKDFMRDITVIKPDWLCELAPHFYQFGTERELASKKFKQDTDESDDD